MIQTRRYHLVTLGCPKNEVDSDKLAGTLVADGMVSTDRVEDAELIVVNTCAFVEDARRESIDTVLALADQRRDGARLVVTGCMAERYGTELADELPEVDQVVGFGVPIALGKTRSNGAPPPAMDLLNLPRPASTRPWAYVQAAEGCDRACGDGALPSFRGPQRSRSPESILAEVDGLGVREVVLVAQDRAAYGRDQGVGDKAIVALLGAVVDRVDWVRLLYL
ncbi:MAG: 30S ribosomal protein S12 methylthiotransferase RimO, partial [Acidimicrobiales bacterium]|nr:30S ribosomal protein S12 methylthiotransferase RimO [Acidimicrobiales bacterium]